MRFVLLAAAITLTAFLAASFSPAQVHGQVPTPTCVMELTQLNGVLSFGTCEDRAGLGGVKGVPCVAPSTGIVLYADLGNGTCLPIIAKAAAGFTAQFRYWDSAPFNGPGNRRGAAWLPITIEGAIP